MRNKGPTYEGHTPRQRRPSTFCATPPSTDLSGAEPFVPLEVTFRITRRVLHRGSTALADEACGDLIEERSEPIEAVGITAADLFINQSGHDANLPPVATTAAMSASHPSRSYEGRALCKPHRRRGLGRSEREPFVVRRQLGKDARLSRG